jgi:hypothetical protein
MCFMKGHKNKQKHKGLFLKIYFFYKGFCRNNHLINKELHDLTGDYNYVIYIWGSLCFPLSHYA